VIGLEVVAVTAKLAKLAIMNSESCDNGFL